MTDPWPYLDDGTGACKHCGKTPDHHQQALVEDEVRLFCVSGQGDLIHYYMTGEW